MRRRRRKPKITISSSQHAIRVPRKKLADLIGFVASQEGVAIAEVDLAVVGSAQVASLNRQYLRHAGPTDVLSFDLSEGSTTGLCIQLVICGDLAVSQAGAHGLTPQRELMLYVVHGLLHHASYADQTVRGAVRMHAREEELLAAFEHRRKA